MEKQTLLQILDKEIVPSLGVTEPGAVAMCAAAASDNNRIQTQRIELIVSPNIYKNCMSVGIPGFPQKGIVAAAALGALAGDYRLGLESLKFVDESACRLCEEWISSHSVSASVSDNGEMLYIEARCFGKQGNGRAIVQKSHSNLTFIEQNGECVFQKNPDSDSESVDSNLLSEITVAELLTLIESCSKEELALLELGAQKNMEAARWGLENRPGMGVGAALQTLFREEGTLDTLSSDLQVYTAAASDVRVSGSFLPIMTCAGSGNHGITAFVPVVRAAHRLGVSHEKMLRALALSNLLTVYIKNYSGKLSGMCGCGVAAATGVAAALAYLLDGDLAAVEGSIKNMAGDITGIICDGAKDGCSLKLATAVGSAVRAATLAVHGIIIPNDNGIIASTAEQTMKNMGAVSAKGMSPTDSVILDLMQRCKNPQ